MNFSNLKVSPWGDLEGAQGAQWTVIINAVLTAVCTILSALTASSCVAHL